MFLRVYLVEWSINAQKKLIVLNKLNVEKRIVVETTGKVQNMKSFLGTVRLCLDLSTNMRPLVIDLHLGELLHLFRP